MLAASSVDVLRTLEGVAIDRRRRFRPETDDGSNKVRTAWRGRCSLLLYIWLRGACVRVGPRVLLPSSYPTAGSWAL